MKRYLQRRQVIKALIDANSMQNISNLQIQASLIKLMINSVYGYSLLNEASNKYKVFVIIPLRRFKRSRKNIKYASIGYVTDKKFCTVERINKKSQMFSVKRILPEIGSLILQVSKVILLRALYFILSHADPSKLHFCYTDTDSIHVALSEQSIR